MIDDPDFISDCPQCGHGCMNCHNTSDVSSITFYCDDCGAKYNASFVIEAFCTGTNLIARGTRHDAENE